jgi:uncharacterized protein (DUF983 family)
MSRAAPPDRPALGTMLRRGLLRRCPWCGDSRAYFTGWFSKQRACRRCGTPWRRGDVGFELGAATVNTIMTFGLIVIGVAVAMIVTAPDIPVVPIVVGFVAFGLVMPALLYPVSYTVWQALDLAMRPPEPGEPASPFVP